MRLIFIRHAEPDYSIDSLTEKGWREAKLLAERVSRWDVKQCHRLEEHGIQLPVL